MAIEVSELLLDDSDETPSEPLTGEPTKSGARRTGRTTRRKKPASSASRPATSGSHGGSRELAQLLAKVIGGASILIAIAVQVDEAAMTPGEANDIARPAARLLGKSGFAAQLAQMANKGGDWIDLSMALATYGLRIYPLIVLRQQQLELQRQAQRGRPVGLSSEDARVWPGSPAQGGADRPAKPTAPAAQNGHSEPAVDLSALAGAGFFDPDALAAGAYGDVAATVRAVTRD